MIGNLTEHSADFGDIIGYENHSGQTFLREACSRSAPSTRIAPAIMARIIRKRPRQQCDRHIHARLAAAEKPRDRRFSDPHRRRRRYGSFDPAAAGQTEAQRAELDRINTIASNARRVAMSRPR